MPSPCDVKPISLGFTPWNKVRHEKYLSFRIPIPQLWQNSYSSTYTTCPPEAWRIPLGSCQFNTAFTFELSAVLAP